MDRSEEHTAGEDPLGREAGFRSGSAARSSGGAERSHTGSHGVSISRCRPGTPSDFYEETEADDRLEKAEAVLAWAEEHWETDDEQG